MVQASLYLVDVRHPRDGDSMQMEMDAMLAHSLQVSIAELKPVLSFAARFPSSHPYAFAQPPGTVCPPPSAVSYVFFRLPAAWHAHIPTSSPSLSSFQSVCSVLQQEELIQAAEENREAAHSRGLSLQHPTASSMREVECPLVAHLPLPPSSCPHGLFSAMAFPHVMPFP